MKTIILFINMLFYAICIFAQSNYYAVTKIFRENGYNYQCDVPPRQHVTLYNKDNKLTYVDPIYKSTGKYYDPELWEFIETTEVENWTMSLCYSIVNNAFASAEKQRMKGRELMTTIYISPDTGKVIEVNFIL